MGRVCSCHGEPMQPNGSKWRCGIRRRARLRRRYHAVLKHDTLYKLNQQIRDLARVRVRY